MGKLFGWVVGLVISEAITLLLTDPLGVETAAIVGFCLGFSLSFTGLVVGDAWDHRNE